MQLKDNVMSDTNTVSPLYLWVLLPWIQPSIKNIPETKNNSVCTEHVHIFFLLTLGETAPPVQSKMDSDSGNAAKVTLY